MPAPRRVALIAGGFVFVGLGALGVFLPVLPTTPFLLVAAWCFARSNPRLGERVLNWRIFRPYRPFLDGSKPIPPRARWITIVIVWGAVTGSVLLLRSQQRLEPWIVALLIGAALAGSFVVLRFRREPAPQTVPNPEHE